MNKLMQQAQQMQEQMVQLQEQARNEVVGIEIDPKAIDPDDPELLADLVTAAVNEALRAGRALVESKVSSMLPSGLGGLLPGM